MIKKIVIKPYTAAYITPITVKAGEAITVCEKETEWPGWFWFKTESGEEGWIPKAYVASVEDGTIAIHNYTTKEFTAETNEIYELIKSEAGWSFCRNNNMEEGWIPDDSLSDFKDK